MDRAFQRIRSLMLRDTFYSVPPKEKTDMQAAINPIILFPPLYSIFPEDNKDAPTNDKTIAAKVTIDFFSLKKTAIVTATASGYIKWMIEATPLAIF